MGLLKGEWEHAVMSSGTVQWDVRQILEKREWYHYMYTRIPRRNIYISNLIRLL